MASAGARLVFLAGFPVVVLERENPSAVRRQVAFAEAVRSGRAVVEGVAGVRVEPNQVARVASRREAIAVVVDPEADLLGELLPAIVVDGRMAKRSPQFPQAGPALLIGLGPGFVAGEDTDAVVETQRGPDLGRVLWSGAAEAVTHRPAPVLGITYDRVLRAPCDGVFAGRARIGDLVTPGVVVGTVGPEPVFALVAGRLRGLVADGVAVARGFKLGDVDPRGARVDPARISDKARAVAAGTLEAVVCSLARQAGQEPPRRLRAVV